MENLFICGGSPLLDGRRDTVVAGMVDSFRRGGFRVGVISQVNGIQIHEIVKHGVVAMVGRVSVLIVVAIS